MTLSAASGIPRPALNNENAAGSNLKQHPQELPAPKEQYQILKNRLEKLGYKDALPLDAVPLVLKLMNDLVQTTDSCRKLKIDHDKFSQDKKRLEAKVEPFKQEINQLTKENNMLHVHLINAADSRDEREKKLQLTMRKYQNEISDLQFMNKQLLAKMEAEQRKTDSERNRLGKTLEMVGISVGREIDAQYLKEQAASALSRNAAQIDIKQGLEPMAQPLASRFRLPELHTADLVRLSDAKCQSSQHEVALLTLKNQEYTNQLETLNEQIKTRDEEIVRLGALLEDEKSKYPTRLVMHNDSEANLFSDQLRATKVEHMEEQLQYLYDTISDMEKHRSKIEKEKATIQFESHEKIDALTAEVEDMYRKNDHMIEDLKTMEKLVSDFERLQRGTIKKQVPPTSTKPSGNPSRVAEVYDELTKARKAVSQKDKTIEDLKTQIKSLSSKVEISEKELQQVQQELLGNLKKLTAIKDHGPDSDGAIISAPVEKSKPDIHGGGLKSLKVHIQALETKLKQLLLQKDTLEVKVQDLQSKNQELHAQVGQEGDQVKILKQKLSVVENQLQETIRERDDVMKSLQESKLQEGHEETTKNDFALFGFSAENLAGDQGSKTKSDEISDEHLNSKILELEQDKSQLNVRIQELTKDIDSKRHEIKELKKLENIDLQAEIRRLIEDFDRERDCLNHEVDAKTEEIVALKDQISSLGKQGLNSDYTLNILSEENRQLQSHVGYQDREILSLKSQLDETKIAKRNIELELEQLKERCSHLQSDLSALANENRKLAEELAGGADTRAQLQEVCADQAQQLEYLGQIVHAKNDEREQIMTSYRKIIQENSDIQNHFKTLETDIQTLRVGLSSKEKELAQMHLELQRAHMVEGELKSKVQTYEMQIGKLNDALKQQEFNLHDKEGMLAKEERELTSLREVVSQAQRSKEDLVRQAAISSSELAHMQKQFEVMVHDHENVKMELNEERIRNEKFERIIADERTKQIQFEIATKDAVRARNVAEDRLAEFEKLQNQKLMSFSSLSSKLIRLEEENKQLIEQIGSLQNSLKEQTELLKHVDVDRIQLKMKLAESEADNMKISRQNSPKPNRRATYAPQKIRFSFDEGVKTPAAAPGPSAAAAPKTETQTPASVSSPSMLEQKIIHELASTKKQLRQYEDLLSKRFPDEQHDDDEIAPPPPPRKSIPADSTSKLPISADFVPKSKSTSSMKAMLGNRAVKEESESDDEGLVAKELLKTWKAQNEAMRRELLSLTSLNSPLTSTPLMYNSKDVPEPLSSPVQQDSSIVDYYQNRDKYGDIDGSPAIPESSKSAVAEHERLKSDEDTRQKMEDENEKLISVVAQVRRDLMRADETME